MIGVLADDFTGASEIGGIGIRYGLNSAIHLEVPDKSDADLVIINTNIRSSSAEEVDRIVEQIIKKMEMLPITWIYSKIDSLLRGPILRQMEALRHVLGRNRVLLVPANPSLGRTIVKGRYYIEGRPLHKSDLYFGRGGALDNADVINLLEENDKVAICSRSPDQPFDQCKFVIGDVNKEEDLKTWARRGMADNRILAGAAEFFNTLVQVRGYQPKPAPCFQLRENARCLFVLGSASSYSRNFTQKAIKQGVRVCEMPSSLFYHSAEEDPDSSIYRWAKEIIGAFKNHNKIIAAVNKPHVEDDAFSRRLRRYTADLVKEVFKQVEPEEFFIEGGATTFSIIKRFNWSTFYPLQELAPGVVRMKVEEQPNLFLTIKPGSYDWPDLIWNF